MPGSFEPSQSSGQSQDLAGLNLLDQACPHPWTKKAAYSAIHLLQTPSTAAARDISRWTGSLSWQSMAPRHTEKLQIQVPVQFQAQSVKMARPCLLQGRASCLPSHPSSGCTGPMPPLQMPDRWIHGRSPMTYTLRLLNPASANV